MRAISATRASPATGATALVVVAFARLLADDEVVVGARRDLRQVRDGEHLAACAELLHQPAHGLGDGAADAGVDLVEDQRRRRSVRALQLAADDRDGERDARELAARGDLGERPRRRCPRGRRRGTRPIRHRTTAAHRSRRARLRSGRRPCRAAASPASLPLRTSAQRHGARPRCGALRRRRRRARRRSHARARRGRRRRRARAARPATAPGAPATRRAAGDGGVPASSTPRAARRPRAAAAGSSSARSR